MGSIEHIPQVLSSQHGYLIYFEESIKYRPYQMVLDSNIHSKLTEPWQHTDMAIGFSHFIQTYVCSMFVSTKMNTIPDPQLSMNTIGCDLDMDKTILVSRWKPHGSF